MPEVDVLLSRAQLLLSQGRTADAVKQLSEVLQQDPNNDFALSLMARARFDQKKFDEGIELIHRAIMADPNESYYHYLLAFGWYQKDDNKKAQESIHKAIQLYPYQADYFGLWALLLLEKNQFEAALQRANEGLAIEAENISCLNTRATALQKLKRTDESIDTMKTALDQDPENYYTHINVGWNLLEKGKQKEATVHFREALRINPNAEAARAGLKQSLKANIPPYKWLLQYSFWLNNKGRQAKWLIPIGIYAGVRVVKYLSENASPGIAMAGNIIVGLYILVALGSWFINPVANIFLLFHKDGKYALTSSEKWQALLTTTSLVAGLGFLVAGLVNSLPEDSITILTGIIFVSLALPLSYLEFPFRLQGRHWTQYFAMALLALGLVCLGAALTGSVNDTAFIVYLVGVIGFTWIIPFSR